MCTSLKFIWKCWEIFAIFIISCLTVCVLNNSSSTKLKFRKKLSSIDGTALIIYYKIVTKLLLTRIVKNNKTFAIIGKVYTKNVCILFSFLFFNSSSQWCQQSISNKVFFYRAYSSRVSTFSCIFCFSKTKLEQWSNLTQTLRK